MSEENTPAEEAVISIKTRPRSAETKQLLDAFWADKTGQPDLMDSLAKELIKLELAIPGLYATILKFLSGGDATANPGRPGLLITTFALWGLALLLTFTALFPLWRQVDTSQVKGDPNIKLNFREIWNKPIVTLDEYFYVVAQYKRMLLLASSILFFLGLLAAAALAILPVT